MFGRALFAAPGLGRLCMAPKLTKQVFVLPAAAKRISSFKYPTPNIQNFHLRFSSNSSNNNNSNNTMADKRDVIRVGGFQLSPVYLNKQATIEKVMAMIYYIS